MGQKTQFYHRITLVAAVSQTDLKNLPDGWPSFSDCMGPGPRWSRPCHALDLCTPHCTITTTKLLLIIDAATDKRCSFVGDQLLTNEPTNLTASHLSVTFVGNNRQTNTLGGSHRQIVTNHHICRSRLSVTTDVCR